MAFIKKNIFIVAALFFAIAAALLVGATVKAYSPNVPVLVAAKNIAVGTQLTESDVMIKYYPKSVVPPSSFKDSSKVIGKTVTTGPIVNNDPIRSEHLTDSGLLLASLRTYAPATWSAVKLPASSGVGLKGIKRGDRVDLYGETGVAQGAIVDLLVKGAVILTVPTSDKDTNYIVAIPDEYSKVIAEKTARNKPIIIVLPEKQ